MNGHEMTEEALADLEKKVSGVYRDAAKDVEKTVNDYFEQFEVRDAEQLKLVESGELSKTDYTQWRLTQMGRGEKYRDLQNKLSERYTDANEVAHSYVYDATPSIYSLNRNYSAYTIEQAGSGVNFNAWNEAAVKKLLIEDPNLMPNYPEWKAFSRGIDLAYGRERITASITSGILQGNSVYKIADDLQKSLENMNRASAIRTARTAFTAAENAGNQDAYEEAEEMGIEMEKEWMATDDDRTREDHLLADGQVVGVDEPFIVGGDELMYPGDPDGEPEQIYNCRCRMVARVAGVDMSDADRWAEKSFDDWLEDKEEDLETIDDWLEETEADSVVEFKEIITETDAEEVFGNSVREWLDDISEEEKDAVINYTDASYGEINAYLRGITNKISDNLKGEINDISDAISKFELKEDIVVYRHMRTDVYDQFVHEGSVFMDDGFLSTSTNANLQGFGNEVLEIHIQAGTGIGAYVDNISEYRGEKEFLMQMSSGIAVESESVDALGNRHAIGTYIMPEVE